MAEHTMVAALNAALRHALAADAGAASVAAWIGLQHLVGRPVPEQSPLVMCAY